MHNLVNHHIKKRKAEPHDSTVMMDLDQESTPLGQEAF